MLRVLKVRAVSLISLALFSGAVFAVTPQEYSCHGMDMASEDKVSFTLEFSEHNGQEFTYKVLTDFIYDGQRAEDIDLTVTKVKCGEREGYQKWSLYDSDFRLDSGCENEMLNIEAKCKSAN